MNKEPVIETDRLILRSITFDDAEACFSWNSDERVTKYMSYSGSYEENPTDIKAICFSPNGNVLNGNVYQKNIIDILNAYRP